MEGCLSPSSPLATGTGIYWIQDRERLQSVSVFGTAWKGPPLSPPRQSTSPPLVSTSSRMLSILTQILFILHIFSLKPPPHPPRSVGPQCSATFSPEVILELAAEICRPHSRVSDNRQMSCVTLSGQLTERKMDPPTWSKDPLTKHQAPTAAALQLSPPLLQHPPHPQFRMGLRD